MARMESGDGSPLVESRREVPGNGLRMKSLTVASPGFWAGGGGTGSGFKKTDRNYITFYVKKNKLETELLGYTTAFYAICNWKYCKRRYTGFTQHQRWWLQLSQYF